MRLIEMYNGKTEVQNEHAYKLKTKKMPKNSIFQSNYPLTIHICSCIKHRDEWQTDGKNPRKLCTARGYNDILLCRTYHMIA